MAEFELLMPKMGESVMEGTIISWLKKPGEAITMDESVLEVATDKVDTEIPSPQSGILKQIIAEQGATIPVGQPIAILEVDSVEESSSTGSATSDTAATPTDLPSNGQPMDEHRGAAQDEQEAVATRRFYSPLVRSIARKEGLSKEVLDRIPGTGLKGRLTKRDLMSYLTSTGQSLPSPVGEISNGGDTDDEIIDMDRMREMIAERMVASKRISAHVTSFVEADVTEIVKRRAGIKQKFYEQEQEPLTLMPFFLRAVVKAIQAFPLVNVSVSGRQIIRHRSIHIGMAVALPTGNLIVPVVHHADRLSLRGLALRINDLSRRARAGELKVDELAGGTYTVSNVGTFGNIMGTPIIMQPQCAILALGAVRKQVAVLTDEQGSDTIGIRHMMYLSHSYDHRVIDGALGGIFAKRVADELREVEDLL